MTTNPIVPMGTCPHIDHINNMLDEIEKNLQSGDKKYNDLLLDTIRNELEVIRRANELLRESSFFWYNKYKRLTAKTDK